MPTREGRLLRIDVTRTRWLWLGSASYLAVLLVTWVRGARLDFDRARMLQFIGLEELAAASWRDLLDIHSQPPGFNALLKFTDQFGGTSDAVLLGVLVVCTTFGVWMTADITYRLTRSVCWGITAGVLAGITPGTVFYSMWAFYTIPTAFLLTASIWGMVRSARTGSLAPATVAVGSIAAAAFMRSSVVWILALIWIVLNFPTLRRAFARSAIPHRWISGLLMGISLAGLLSVQAHAAAKFESPTLSTWGFENAAKALQTTMSDDEINEIASSDLCLAQVLDTGVFRPIDEYPKCARGSITTEELTGPLLTQLYWSNGAANMNHIDRLALSDQWAKFVTLAVAENPLRVLRIPFPSLVNQERGTIVRFLWPSSWYWIIEGNVAAGGMLTTVWVLAFAWVPGAMIVLLLLGLVRARHLWPDDAQGVRLFRIVGYSVLALVLMYLFLETGENERFRVEIDWLLIALGVTVLGNLLKRQSRERSSIASTFPRPRV